MRVSAGGRAEGGEGKGQTASTTEVIIVCNHAGRDLYRYSTSCKDGLFWLLVFCFLLRTCCEVFSF